MSRTDPASPNAEQQALIAFLERAPMSLLLQRLDPRRLLVTLPGDTPADTLPRLDELTQVPDREALLQRLQMALERPAGDAGHGFALMFVNLDRFKQINDSHGHDAGNAVLRLMAERLRSTLRQRERARAAGAMEDMVARLGSDEFGVLLDLQARPDDVHAVARRLLELLAQPYGVGAVQLHCGASMGLVLRAQAAARADTVLQDASIAMVEAKRGGGGRYVVFEPEMSERAARRGAIESELRRALGAGELFVVYQPVVALAGDGRPDPGAGVEALVRWRHPQRGIVPPLDFIGVAEECGLIGAVGDHVLASACRQFVRWQHTLGALAPRMLAVNLSRAQLAQPHWADTVRGILVASGMPPQQLQLEVTESLAAQDETVQQRLHELKALRLTLALDDFGTGYSSLASLHLMPVDTVKIDRSFVAQVDSSDHHRVLIEATVRVASSLGMDTVAEGIETEAQAAAIRELGCDKGQGYLYSRPLGADDLPAWLAAARDG